MDFKQTVRYDPPQRDAHNFVQPSEVEGAGYPDKAKSSGILIRGTQAQTKARTAKGSM